MLSAFAIILVLFGTVVGSVGALVIKKGTNKYSLRRLVFTIHLWIGVFLYGLSSVFYIVALRIEELTVIYPLVSTSFIWTTLLSLRYLDEKMNKWKWYALIGIVIGVVLIGIGS